MKTVHIIISGLVQGIGYRKWVKQHAHHVGVVGWIKNREDGAVEAVLQGEKGVVDTLMKEVQKGPFLANVQAIDIQEFPYDPQITSFVVIQ
jgi:acylphosphatase